MRWIGAVFVIAGCSGWGLMLASNDKREEKYLRELLQALSWLESDLSCRMWPLPTLFGQVADKAEGEMGGIFRELGMELDRQDSTDAGECMDKVLRQYPDLPGKCRGILFALGKGLGSFDLDGQLREIKNCRSETQAALEKHCEGKDQRLRCYRALGICAGCALALLLL